MPHALVHRAATGTVESVPLKGMPLGGFADYPYTTRTLRLDPGDTVVLMSDGFPELFNDAGEMLGYDEVESHVRAGVDGSADALVTHLCRVMDELGRRPPLPRRRDVPRPADEGGALHSEFYPTASAPSSPVPA